jgi:hypothetical protein
MVETPAAAVARRFCVGCGKGSCPHLVLPHAMVTPRRFPPPWSVEELEVGFVVKNRDGQQLAYVYFED